MITVQHFCWLAEEIQNGPGLNEANPAGTAVRINVEVAGHLARRGLYIVQEIGGHVIASWYALDGWTDSGWFENVEISGDYTQLRVLHYPGPNTNPTEMRIMNMRTVDGATVANFQLIRP